MAGDPPKPSIPAWQRATAATPATQKAQGGGQTVPGSEKALPAPQPVPEEDNAATRGEDEVSPVDNSSSQLDMVETLLSEPQIKDAPTEEKRAFLESKEVPVETIDQVLKTPDASPSSSFATSDFVSFRQQQQPMQHAAEPQSQPPPASAPPIITYPEFLANAHTPAPLVTSTRVLNATYFAASVASLFYGVSNFLVKPMTANLTEARHEFSTHSKSKIDEFNDRLSKIVSKVPKPTAAAPAIPNVEIDETASLASDPTELYHRDMGTQTSPLPSRRSSDSDIADTSPASARTSDSTKYQTDGLEIIKSHLNEILEGVKNQEETNQERQGNLNQLRHELDLMMYGNVVGGLWDQDQGGGKKEEKRHSEIDNLKKEIRGVKGVLLSARRFPGVVR